jgi:glycosyltransferase involved in cell wall biosynthesis
MPVLGNGGTETQCIEVLAELARDRQGYGVDVELATLYRHVVDAPKRPDKLPLHLLNQSRVAQSGMPRSIALLSKLIPQFDCVHAMLWPSIWATAMARRGRAAFVASIHSSHERPGPLGLKRAVDRMAVQRADMLVFNSAAGRARLTSYFGLDPQRIEVVTNGKTPFAGPEVPRSGLICMARFWPPKRHDLLLAALRLLPAALRPRATFIGYRTAGPEFRALVATQGLDDIELPGEVSDPVPLLAAAQISALPTDNEGMPNAVLESWNTGTPVIASKVPGVLELVHDGVDGLLVENTPQAWAAGLELLLGDAELRASLARAGRERFQRDFSIQHCARAWADLYHRAVASKVRTGAGTR